jgi:two-component system sensor histidine kinase DevS
MADLSPGALWDSVPDALVLVDGDGCIAQTNLALEELFGYRREQLVGEPVEVLLPEEHRGGHVRVRRLYAERPVRRPMGAGQLLRAQRADGTVFPVHISLSPLVTGTNLYTVAAVRDLSSWVEDQDRLADATRRRMLAEDHERIARELHDTVIQELFGVGMALQAVQADAQPAMVADRLAGAVDDIDEIIRRIRGVIFDLSRPANARRGLRSVIIDTVASCTPSLGFEPKLAFDGPIDGAVSDAIAEHLVPTIREALSNVARHAGANGADVRVDVGDDVRLVVADDGRGIGTTTGRRSGLANLARRAAILGGSLTIEDRPGGGTLLEWVVPLLGPDGEG